MSSPFVYRNASSRQSRPGLRRTTQTTSNLRGRTSPKSPSRRILTESNSVTGTPLTLRKRSSTEADREQDTTSTSFSDDKENGSSQEDTLGSRHVYTRQEKRRSGGSMMSFMPPPQSPMKRSEPMAVDSTEIMSPSAKRRSLHGPSVGSDFFSIFESDTLSNAVHDNRSQDDNDWLRTASPLPSSRFSTVPKRASSLRKSTIQQRQAERSPFNMKFTQPTELESSLFSTTPFGKNDKSLRMSLDNHIDPMPRESPFSAQGHLLNASIHPATVQHQSQQEGVPSSSRHPLSRTVTQSSSTTSIQDDSPTHEPFHRPARPKSHDFSRSLPAGALNPLASADVSEHSSQSSFATPGAYKSAKPLPAAFMSTGLISKKNRNAEDPNGGLPKAHMPDTPCKRHSVLLPTNRFGNVKGVMKQNRESFGMPATPAEARSIRPLAFHSGNAIGLGARATRPSLMRKMSFASIGSEAKKSSQSPSQGQDSQSTESDLSPTPTRHFDEPLRGLSVSPSPRHGRNLSVPIAGSNPFPSSKLLPPIIQSPESVEDANDGTVNGSPSAIIASRIPVRKSQNPSASFTKNRMLKNMTSPTPLARSALVLSTQKSPVMTRTKSGCFTPVTPHGDRANRYSPHTPQEGCFPPDPSGLSISGRPSTRNGFTPAIPATPTGPREYFSNFSHRPSLDQNAARDATADSSLTSRFEKVDLVGTGEFSEVYRVSQPPQSSPYHKIYVTNGRSSSRSSMQERVWAVKKSRHAYTGYKDRQRKLKEVEILKVLGRSEHVIGFVDSWENEDHLYIQTEFCEEGTLSAFLSRIGAKARLDDFRIWKILLELSTGLQHIHDCGFIHLDLKPANVLISFEGALKIADFGMAVRWPAAAGTDGEGDREYIGPEVLTGKFDKPADVFALGLMMLETAGNVELPDNGASWQKLRSGDMSDVPSLTFSSDNSIVTRDASGNPVDEDLAAENVDHDMVDGVENAKDITPREGELLHPPQFMVDAEYPQSLDSIVRWMISPDPLQRPVASQILATEGVRFVGERRRAGATVYEGNWGPADEILRQDHEMIDV
ncbi:Mitosis inhibitor protein kinase wee1 [Cyphellophora attinorum]|uniref:Mitosis inhibitor protein kinase wee1 n=1 Tax=Cyphellophora attinorum TaxID=1664694 RepID=A0A0N1P367_9EURO|nr:Mitosis inhibitor protein kinase wee1 [Phialophora attinorum]KPI45030.1 Mitosis inhibitor protein kinase wee1 [Phialophora attinorum]